MQISDAEAIPVPLKLSRPAQMAGKAAIKEVLAIFVRLETRAGHIAWGCGVAHPELTGEEPQNALKMCQIGIDMAPDLHPVNIEYSLAILRPNIASSPAAVCAFDLAFHDLLGLSAGMPLYRILGGYRNQIQTSATVPNVGLDESVDIARRWAALGFEILKIKGGQNPDLDVRRVQAIRRALPDLVYRFDADGGYSVQQAVDVARALEGKIEIFEQPTAADDLVGLRQVTRLSPVPILADQSITDPSSAVALAGDRIVDGISIKLANCGGVRCAQQMDAVARASQLMTMVGCVLEPRLLIAAGLSLALSSPNVKYGDLDGFLDVIDDPSEGGFILEEGRLTALEVPGLGCTVSL